MANFDWSDLVPEHHAESDEISALFDIWQDFFESELRTKSQQLKELHNPDKFPFDFVEAFEDMLGTDVPIVRGQGEEATRRQLGNAIETIKLKGLELGVQNFFAALGYSSSTQVQQSFDYFRFTPDDELKRDFGVLPDRYFYTPHVEIRFTPAELIDGTFLTSEVFDIIENRLNERILPVTTVADYRLQLVGEAEEDHNLLFNNFVSGTSLIDYQRKNSEKFSSCHKVQQNEPIQPLRTFQFSYLEFANKVEFGTFNSGTQIDSGTENLDKVLFDTTDFEVKLDPSNDKAFLDVDVNSSIDKKYNGAIVRDDFDQPIVAYHFPKMEVFNIDNLTVDWELTVNKTLPTIHKAEVSEFEDTITNEVDDPTVHTTSEYYHAWDKTTTLREPFFLDKGLSLDEEDNLPFLSVLSRDGSAWSAGDLSDATGDGPHFKESNGQEKMWNPFFVDEHKCSEFDLFFSEGHDKIVFECDLVQSPLFGETVEQIGLFDESGHLILVAEFDEGVEITDQFNREKFRLTMNIEQN